MKLKKILLVAVAAVLAASLLFGAVFGIIYAVRRARAVAYYGNVTVSEGVYRYFAYKALCRTIAEVQSEGGPFVGEAPLIYKTYRYYDLTTANGKTVGERYLEKTDTLVRRVLVLASKFDACGYTVDNDYIEDTLEEMAQYHREKGADKSLKEELADFGISERDYKSAMILWYKACYFYQNYYGLNGSLLTSLPELCEQYLAENYKAVKLLFIRTENTFVLENGERKTNSEGEDVHVSLTDDEKAQRQAQMAVLDGMIATGTVDADAYNALFETYAVENDGADAYYFNADSSFTATSLEEQKEMTEAALASEVGKLSKVAFDGGYVYILGLAVTEGAYASAARSECFSDFYKLAALADFTNSLAVLCPAVTVKEKAASVDVFYSDYAATRLLMPFDFVLLNS